MIQISKTLVLIATLLLVNSGFSQSKALDLLIAKIDNKDAYVVMANTLSPRINSDAGVKIIAIGKEATPKLIRILEDKDKGIIAHFILSEIWKAKWTEQTCCNIFNDGNAEIVVINGLKIHIENNFLYVKPEDLKQNMENWRKLLAV